MLIYFKPTPDGVFTALHRQQAPPVYLDMLALRIAAESPELGWHAGFEIDSRALLGRYTSPRELS
jgi:hypothetical protein